MSTTIKIAGTIAEIKSLRREMKGSVGFVPTMGYLHDGHISLARQAKKENDHVIASIFVNPTQFGPREDFKTYPRDIDRDLALLKDTTDAVFIPINPEVLYPPGYNTWVICEGVTEPLEGQQRPGHFKGVSTVVAKLFNIVEPTRSYFGQKDAQQVRVIQQMVRDLNMNLDVIICPTVREPDGLAMSSRNTYLNPEERKAAVVLYQSLMLAQNLWQQGERNADTIRNRLTALINSEPLANIEYVSVADDATLHELKKIESAALVSLAVRVGKTRLIDNITLQ
jgi:pantoate--beta-alanine ligase